MQRQAKKWNRRRLFALLLAFCVFFTSLPASAATSRPPENAKTASAEQSDSADVRLLVDGEELSAAVLPTDGHLNLTAKFSGEAAAYAWQILLPDENLWVDISGAASPTLQVGCGTVISALRADGIAYVRCQITAGDAAYYSAALQIHVTAAKPAEPEPDEGSKELVVVSEEQVTQTPVEEPVETPEEPGEESNEESSEESTTEEESALEESAAEEESAPDILLPEESEPSEPSKPEVAVQAMEMPNVTAPGDPGEEDSTAGGELITHYITVEYVDKNGSPIYSGFTAQVKHNAPFAQTNVVFPTILGYTPYFRTAYGIKDGTQIDENTPGATEAYKDADGNVIWGLQKNQMTIQSDSVTEDIHYQVVYYPNKVSYTVTHYAQSTISDEYVLCGVETKTGYVGEMTDATNLVNETSANGLHLGDGYIALIPFANVEIAADGTTQVNAYYDRMYFLMRFKLGEGGRGVSPIYAQYESPIMVGSPVRTGYTFEGWEELEMENIVTDTGSSIWIPKVGDDDKFVVKVGGRTEPPETMPAENTAYQAKWKASNTSYTVVYWLQEAPMYLDEIGTDMPYAFWCSTTADARSGDVVNKDDVKDPVAMGIGGATTSGYMRYIPTSADDLDGKSFVLVSARFPGHYVVNEKKDNGLTRGKTFNAGSGDKFTEWTFEKSGSGYKLRNGSNYMQMDNNGYISFMNQANATIFTVDITSNGVIKIGNGSRWINAWDGEGGDRYQGWTEKNDDNNNFQLYIYSDNISTEREPYYYFDHFANEEPTVTVAPDGTTLINVFYKRKTYNLRFFYGREKGGESQIFLNYTGNFSTSNRTDNIDELLKGMGDGSWGKMEAGQSLTPGESGAIVTLGEGLKHGTLSVGDWTYHYLAFSAQYGQRIADLWPNACLQPTRAYKDNQFKTIPFSAWTGEYWLKYERDEAIKQSQSQTYNYTIKGLYAQLDERLLYDSSYGAGYADKGTEEDYLDFFTYWQFPNGDQYLFYLWTEITELDGYDTTKAITKFPEVKTAQGKQDFGVTPETEAGDTHPVTIYKDTNGKYYRLARLIETYDDSGNDPLSQTYPAIVGYKFRTEILNGVSGWNNQYFYNNPNGKLTSFENCRSLNFMYDAVNYNLELYSSGQKITSLTAHFGERVQNLLIKDGSGADDYNYLDAAWMEEHCYPSNLPRGAYTFGGWYKSSTFQQEIDADGTYPAKDMIINARWVPKKFNVRIYQTSDKNQLVYTDNAEGTMSWTGEKSLDYGSALPADVKAEGPNIHVLQNRSPKDGEYDGKIGTGDIRVNWVFQCYAYMKDGVEHAIDVNTFTVTEDVDIYAKWTATSIVSYKINYVLANLTSDVTGTGESTTITIKDGTDRVYSFDDAGQLVDEDGTPWVPTAQKDGDGNSILVAPSLEGKQNQGANRTFIAKTGQALYAAYQSGHYPLTASHTLLMEVEDPEEGGDPVVEYTFYYIPMKEVPYTVHYLDSNRNPLVDTAYKNTNNAVVTENFQVVSNYTPDAFQKSLVLSANPAENVITFHYTQGAGSTYTISHYFQTLGDNYVEQMSGKNYSLYTSLSDTVKDGEKKVQFVNRATTGYEYVYYTMQYIDEKTGELYYVDAEGKKITGTDPMMVAFKEVTETGPTFTIYDAAEGGEAYTVTVSGTSFTITKDGKTFRPNEKTFYFPQGGSRWKIQSMKSDEAAGVKIRIAPTSVTVPAGEYGTLIKVYYNLKTYPYTVNHWLVGDGSELKESERSEGVFQSQITGESWTKQDLIERGYVGYRVDKDEKQIIITQNIQDDSQNPTINVINFYYYEIDMQYSYQPMVVKTPGGGGITQVVDVLDDPNAYVTVKKESIKAVTGTADTSTAVWNEKAYTFKGWYLDEACTIPAGAPTDAACTVNGAAITPQKTTEIHYKDSDNQEKTWKGADFAGIYVGDYHQDTGSYAEEKTFYTLFAPKLGNLTIRRENLGPDFGHNEANSFVYHVVQTKDGEESAAADIDMYVTIDPGQSSVTIANLPFGTYQVTQENTWSWRYSDVPQEVTIQDTNPYPQVTFARPIAKKTWLSGYGQPIKNKHSASE